MVQFIKNSIYEIEKVEPKSSEAFSGSPRLSKALNGQLFKGILSCGAPELPDLFQVMLCSEWSMVLRNTLRMSMLWSPEPLKLSSDVNVPFIGGSDSQAFAGSAILCKALDG